MNMVLKKLKDSISIPNMFSKTIPNKGTHNIDKGPTNGKPPVKVIIAYREKQIKLIGLNEHTQRMGSSQLASM
jgi:hypothetical protein